MGYMQNQDYSPETFPPHPPVDPSKPPHREPPPLPPRDNSSAYLSPSLQPPPSYSETVYTSQPLTHSWSSQDPRSSSTQSLVPAQSAPEKRTLLLIYIHGFLGNETSFQSFPAHVHNIVTVILADTHMVHTKIYPRYKSRKAIEYARDDFSNWFCPHESENTDVVLVGHSMGGILAAEVALLSPYSRASDQTFRHRILGTINFDCPFLGIHPGVVVSGIGSLFRSAPEFSPGPASNDISTGSSPLSQVSILEQASPTPPGYFDPSVSQSDLHAENSPHHGPASTPQGLPLPTIPLDPNYNPPFPNDIRRPIRTNWDNAVHFMMKHSDGLTRAARSYVTSHLEFGGCLADYKGLKNRYSKIRALEDNHSERIRFVNYYTASTGRPKKPKSSAQNKSSAHFSHNGGSQEPVILELQELSLSQRESRSPIQSPQLFRYESRSRSPRISVEEHQDGKIITKIPVDSDEPTIVASDQYSARDTAACETSPEMTLLNATPATDEESEDNEGDISDNELAVDAVSAPANTISGPLNTQLSFAVDPATIEKDLALPPLPTSPKEPPEFDPGYYADKDARALAQKQYARQQKVYLQALKDYGKAIREREKLVEKRQKAAKKESDRMARLKEKETIQNLGKKERNPSSIAAAPASSDISSDDNTATSSSADKPLRDKKFCLLPPKINNHIDHCWVRVVMRDLDEVGAHCGLFFIGEQYGWLVSDVGNRIKEWVVER